MNNRVKNVIVDQFQTLQEMDLFYIFLLLLFFIYCLLFIPGGGGSISQHGYIDVESLNSV